MADTARLRKVMDQIDGLMELTTARIRNEFSLPADLDTWYQGDYIRLNGTAAAAEITDAGIVSLDTRTKCGTACCFAGWAVAMFGEPGTIIRRASGTLTLADGSTRSTGDYAAELLGLTSDQRRKLFGGGNTRKDLHRIVDTICEGEE